jgi:hypothetical protein
MICAILNTDNCEATYYSSNDEEFADPNLAILLNDFDDLLPEGEAVAVTTNEDGDVVLMEYVSSEDWGRCDLPAKPMCYNVMKAYCDAYNLGMAIPEYLGPYTLEVARAAFESYGDYMTIIPVMCDLESCDAS